MSTSETDKQQKSPAAPPEPNKTVMPTRKLVAPPEAAVPAKLAGVALYVTDLEAQKEWYETMFGFRTYQVYERDGKIFEYVMTSPEGNTGLALMSGLRPPGYNSYCRLIFEVPNPRALAEHVHSQGSSMSVILKNYVYMIMDPEGNQIEIFSRNQQSS